MEQLFAALAAALKAKGFTRFIVAGETSSIVAQTPGLRRSILGRPSPGVPRVRDTRQPLSPALKSGNFGDIQFLPVPSRSFVMTEQQLREEMVQIGASLFSRGYATGSAGNLSLLLPDGNLLATPTGACLGELQAQRLSVVTLQGEWISGDKPSKEVTFHRAVYLHNPACKAIVHLHSHYLTALS